MFSAAYAAEKCFILFLFMLLYPLFLFRPVQDNDKDKHDDHADDAGKRTFYNARTDNSMCKYVSCEQKQADSFQNTKCFLIHKPTSMS